MMGFRSKGTVQGNKIRFGQQLRKSYILHIQIVVRVRVISEYVHAEPMENTYHSLADFPGSYHTCNLMIEISSHKTVNIHIKITGSPISLMGKPVYRKQHGHCKFRHRLR